jgi:hypothetical protein
LLELFLPDSLLRGIVLKRQSKTIITLHHSSFDKADEKRLSESMTTSADITKHFIDWLMIEKAVLKTMPSL